ncbi:MAG: hypothetical protein KIT69_20860, partial [Propionibacteriaceae bacterium]|nr:hypothetical protein [Propionibacteriaceae bacterium]
MTASGLVAAVTASLTVPAIGLAGADVAVEFNSTPGAPVPLRLTLSNVSLEIAGQSLTVVSLTVQRSVAGGQATTDVILGNATLQLAGLVEATISSGTLRLSAAGITGTMTATVSTSLPALELTTGVEVQVNTNPLPALGLPAGPYLRIAATGASLTIGGQSLTGSIVIVQSAAALDLTVSNASISFGGGAIALSNGAGQLNYSSTGISGSLSGTVTVTIPGVALTGSLRLDVDTVTGKLAFTGTGLSLSIYGQTLSGNLTVTSTATTVTIEISEAAFNFGSGLVRLTNGAAELTITAGVLSGWAQGTAKLAVPGVAANGTFRVEIDAAAVAPVPTLRIGVPADTSNSHPELTITVAGVELQVESLWFSRDAAGTIRLSLTGAGLAFGPAG